MNDVSRADAANLAIDPIHPPVIEASPSTEKTSDVAQAILAQENQEQQREILQLLARLEVLNEQLAKSQEKPKETPEEKEKRLLAEIKKLHKKDPFFANRVQTLLTSVSQVKGEASLGSMLWTVGALSFSALLGTGKAMETLVLSPFYAAKKLYQAAASIGIGDFTGTGHFYQAYRELAKSMIYLPAAHPEHKAFEEYTGPASVIKPASRTILQDEDKEMVVTVDCAAKEVSLEGVVWEANPLLLRLWRAGIEMSLGIRNFSFSTAGAGLMVAYVLGKNEYNTGTRVFSTLVDASLGPVSWAATMAARIALFSLCVTLRTASRHPYEALVALQAFSLLSFAVQAGKNASETKSDLSAIGWITAGMASLVAIPTLNALNTAIYNYPTDTLF